MIVVIVAIILVIGGVWYYKTRTEKTPSPSTPPIAVNQTSPTPLPTAPSNPAPTTTPISGEGGQPCQYSDPPLGCSWEGGGPYPDCGATLVCSPASTSSQPHIFSLSPGIGPVNAPIRIIGSGFLPAGAVGGGETYVKFSFGATGSSTDIIAQYESSSILEFPIPSALDYLNSIPLVPGAYDVSVINPDGGISNSVVLTVTSSTFNPSIDFLSPDHGPVGTIVTIHGSGFDATGNTIQFGTFGDGIFDNGSCPSNIPLNGEPSPPFSDVWGESGSAIYNSTMCFPTNNFSSEDGNTIMFKVPFVVTTFGASCEHTGCNAPEYHNQITPGIYPISISMYGYPQTNPVDFTVTAQ